MAVYGRCGSLDTRIRIIETGETFETAKECASNLNRCPAAVWQCLTGKSRTCGGYHLELISVDPHDYIPYDMFEGRTVEISYAPGYFISDLGIAYGPGYLGHRGYHELASYSSDKYGHQVVDIDIDGKRRHKYLAVLVAEAFVPNPYNYPVVRHLDGDPLNNHAFNLAWGTHQDNMDDAKRHGTFHYFTPEEDEMSLRVLRKPVKAINIRTGEEYEFVSIAEAARELGVYGPNINHVLSGHYRQTGGYTFEYLDKDEFDAEYYK